MRIFVTGATGFVGSAVVQELLAAGHQVLGLARSDKSAQSLAAAGAEVHHGSLHDLESLRRGATAADAVIHTAFIHDFSNYGPAAEADRRAIESLGETLAGSDRPLIVTSGTLVVASGRKAREEDLPHPEFPRKSEEAALGLAARGVRASVLRLPPSVHGEGDHGFVPRLIGIAREKGVSAYVGDGRNRWPAVHRLDAAHLYRLVLEKGTAGAKYHGVAEEGIAMRAIAETIGAGLGVPVRHLTGDEAQAHFDWMAHFVAIDNPTSSALTRNRLGCRPQEPELPTDMKESGYF